MAGYLLRTGTGRVWRCLRRGRGEGGTLPERFLKGALAFPARWCATPRTRACLYYTTGWMGKHGERQEHVC